ncbi:MAG: hypothetical protein COA61_002195 [Zetaproteobacteria bacterium]|nr:hypothetical protein [Zetaproteobacteria bacterium]
MTQKKEIQAPVDEGNIDQIRDIIFGAQMRDYEKRFIRLEEKMQGESATLRSETSNRLDALELYIKQEVGSLLDQLSLERGEREDDTRHLSDELSKKSKEADKKNGQLQQSLNQGKSELRDALLDQSKSLLKEIQSVRDTLNTSLNRSTDELRDDKADRRALADMFNEVAMRLNGEFTLPKKES